MVAATLRGFTHGCFPQSSYKGGRGKQHDWVSLSFAAGFWYMLRSRAPLWLKPKGSRVVGLFSGRDGCGIVRGMGIEMGIEMGMGDGHRIWVRVEGMGGGLAWDGYLTRRML